VWDTATGACLHTLNGHSDLVMSVCFSPDGQRIVSSSRDQSARLWDVASGTELLTFKGHRGWLFTAVFSPDGRRIVTAGGDGTAKVWQAATVEQVESHLRERTAEAAAVAEQEIKRWLVLLPIPFEGSSGAEALQVEQVVHENRLRPRVGERVKTGRGELVWRESENYRLDFNQIMGCETPFSVAYAVCYLESPVTQTNLVLRIGSDDQAKILLNEREVYRSTKTQAWEPERNTVSGIELKAGLNVLVFKVVNELGGWEASVRITDATGQSIKGLRMTLDPGTRN
jgi:hypothetical protein